MSGWTGGTYSLLEDEVGAGWESVAQDEAVCVRGEALEDAKARLVTLGLAPLELRSWFHLMACMAQAWEHGLQARWHNAFASLS